jgi:histidine kinase
MIGRFDVVEVLYKSAGVEVYRCREPDTGTPHILKCTQPNTVDLEGPARLRSEYETMSRLAEASCAHIPRPVEFFEAGGRSVLVMSDLGGERLAVDRVWAVADVLKIARQLALAVADMHRLSVLHCDINPNNVVRNNDTGEVQLIDFDIARTATRERLENGRGEGVGSLAYMPPEQTGRVAASVDHRSDLYAIGATLHALLTGRPPIEAADLTDLVHRIVTQPVQPLHLVRADVPVCLSRVVEKLLAKAPANRYQSVHGLLRDLDACEAVARAGGDRPDFSPGTHDRHEHLELPTALFGRRDVCARLEAAYNDARQGKPGVFCLSGPSGIGKTACVDSLLPALARDQAIYGAGKFDQVRQGVPFSALGAALTQATHAILAGTETEVQHHKQLVRAAIGDRGQALVDLVPALGPLLGEQGPVPDLPPIQQQNRLLRLFSQLFAAFTTARPCILFLDDMQWSDEGSRQVILHVMQHVGQGAKLLLVVAARPEGVAAGHPLEGVLSALGPHVHFTHAVLEPLRATDVTALLATSMGIAASPQLEGLGALVADKSGGNPYFVRSLVRQLWGKGLIDFDARQGAWRWDTDAIRALAVADNVAEFTVQAMQDLPAACREVLGTAACVGYHFELTLLARVCERSAGSVLAALRPAFDTGIIIHVVQASDNVPEALQFTHDRVYQASVALLSADADAAAHHRVAQALVSSVDLEHAAPEVIFALVDHLEACQARLDATERETLRRCVVLAGHCARRAMNYATAKRYFSAALAAMPDGDGAEPGRFDTALALAQVELLSQDLDAAAKTCTSLVSREATPIQRAALLRTRGFIALCKDDIDGAIAAIVEGLAALGHRISGAPSVLHVGLTMMRLRSKVAKIDIQALARRPMIDDPRVVQITMLLGDLTALAHVRSRHELAAVCNAHLFSITLDLGITPMSACATGIFALTLKLGFGDTARAEKLADLADAIGAHHPQAWLGGRAINAFMVRGHAYDSPDVAERKMRAAYQASREEASSVFEGSLLAVMTILLLPHSIERLLELRTLQAEASADADLTRCIWNAVQAGLCLAGRTRAPTAFTDDPAVEEAVVVDLARGPIVPRYNYYSFKQLACFIHRDLPAAVAHAGQIWDVRPYKLFTTPNSLHLDATVSCLAMTQLAQATGARRVAIPRYFRWATGALKKMTAEYPGSYYEIYGKLVAADVAAMQGRTADALQAYLTLDSLLEACPYRAAAAIGHECAGRFYLRLNLTPLAARSLRRARALYDAWGVLPKVESLTAEFGDLLHVEEMGAATLPTTRKTAGAASETPTSKRGKHPRTGSLDHHLDIATIVDAAESMASERNLERLIERLMQATVAAAGADTGLLALESGGGLEVRGERREASGTRDGSAPRAPMRVLNLAVRTGAAVSVCEGEASPLWQDPYFAQGSPKALLCLPLMRQGKALGALYLEHQSLAQAFLPERQKLVATIAAQAAVAIENATLYGALEQRVAERTAELDRARARLVALERRGAERQMAGGFAHEVLNALHGPMMLAEAWEGEETGEASGQWAETSARVEAGLESGTPAGAAAREALEALRDSARHDRAVVGEIMHGVRRTVHITRRILEYGQIDEAAPGLELCDVGGTVQKVLSDLRQRASEEVQTMLVIPDGAQVRMQQRHLELVLRSLLSNAYDAVHAAGRSPARVSVSLRSEAETLLLEVGDNGSGIAEAIRGRLFEPFVTTKGAAGAGLDLGITKKVVALYGGQIQVRSDANTGTVFSIQLPRL